MVVSHVVILSFKPDISDADKEKVRKHPIVLKIYQCP